MPFPPPPTRPPLPGRRPSLGPSGWWWIRFQNLYRYDGGDLMIMIQHHGASVRPGPMPFDAVPADANANAAWAADKGADAAPGGAGKAVLVMQLSYR